MSTCPLRLIAWRINLVSASSWLHVKKATSKVGSVKRTSSSLEQPPDTMIVVSAGAWATISSERNLARSPLFPSERNACHLIGSGTCLPSIILRTGRAVFLERRPLVVAFMECLR